MECRRRYFKRLRKGIIVCDTEINASRLDKLVYLKYLTPAEADTADGKLLRKLIGQAVGRMLDNIREK